MEQDVRLSELLSAYSGFRPSAIPTLRTVLKTVAPWVWKKFRPQRATLEEWLEAVPAHELYSLLSGSERPSWCADIAGRLPPGYSYQKAYARFVHRLIAYGEEVGLLHPDHHFISPGWHRIVAALEPHLSDLPATKRSAMRSSLRRLARWATAANIEPLALPVGANDGHPMAAFKATFPAERDGDFYRARKAWNMIAASNAGLGLTEWPPEPPSPFAALHESKWPALVIAGLAELLSQGNFGLWSSETRAGYRHRVGSYIGTLERLGLNPEFLVASACDGKDAFRILFQGVPAGAGVCEDARKLSDHLTVPDVAARLLEELRSYEGRFEGRACEANPLVLSVTAAMVGAGYLTSARDLLLKTRAINQGMLGVTSRHTNWCGRRLRQLDDRARRSPSSYARKKRAVFRTPKLWAQLVATRRDIRKETRRLEEALTNVGRSALTWQRRRWAIALRNEVLFGFLLCYPLRARNVIEMRLGDNFDPRTFRIYFPPEDTKNGKEIDYELPEGGALGDLRALFHQYLTDARPALLAGRQSEYVFVPDPRGGIRLRDKAVNAILADLSRRYLKDALPAGVSILNPHLVRHAVATFHVAVGRDVNLAAQMLNDEPATITQAYADVLECKKEATKGFLSNFTL